MADMVKPYVAQNGNNPGTGDILLGSVLAGRRSFSNAYPTGGDVYYYVVEPGGPAEWGSGPFAIGAPDTISRANVWGNTLGTTSHLNFTGDVIVYNEYPGDRIVALDTSGNVALPSNLTVSGNQTVAGTLSVGGIGHVAMLRGHIDGLGLSRVSATTFGVAAGVAVDSTAAAIINVTSAWTKSISGVWVAGSGNNGMGTGVTASAGLCLHVFGAIISGAIEIFADSSVSAANKPAGTTYFRRLGSLLLDGSGQITAFFQNADQFLLASPVLSLDTSALGAASTYATLAVPTGVIVEALVNGVASNPTTSTVVLVHSPNIPDQAAYVPDGNGQFSTITTTNQSGEISVLTDTSGRVRVRAFAAGTVCKLTTKGWIDRRGKE